MLAKTSKSGQLRKQREQLKMTTSQLPKILSPTLHFYHYVLRNGLNDSDERVKSSTGLFYGKFV